MARLNQIHEMLMYAEFVVWIDEVDTGHIEHSEAEEILAVAYETWNATEAVKVLQESPSLYALYLKWYRARYMGVTA